jgi:hypothetical protein
VRRAVPTFVVLLGLAFAAPADASRCVGTTLDGDRVTTANAFETHGINCKDALVSAADYVDSYSSEKGIKATQEGKAVTIRFLALTPLRRYHWTCRLAELPRRERHGRYREEGWRYQCHTGAAQMSFKWWLFAARKCPAAGLVEELEITRNEPCPGSNEMLEPTGLYETRTATSYYETGEPPEKHYYEWMKRFYHYGGFLCTSEGGPKGREPNKLTWECVQQKTFDPSAYWWRETVV